MQADSEINRLVTLECRLEIYTVIQCAPIKTECHRQGIACKVTETKLPLRIKVTRKQVVVCLKAL